MADDEGDFTLNLSSVISNVFNSAKKERGNVGHERRTLGANKCCIEEDNEGEGEKLLVFDKENLFTPLKGKKKSVIMEPQDTSVTKKRATLTPVQGKCLSQAQVVKTRESTPDGCLTYSTTKRRSAEVVESPSEEETPVAASPARHTKFSKNQELHDDDDEGEEEEEEEPVTLRSARKPASCAAVLESPEDLGLVQEAGEDLSGSPDALEAAETREVDVDVDAEATGPEDSINKLRAVFRANEGLATISRGLRQLRDGGLDPTSVLLDVVQVGAQLAPLPEDLLDSQALTEEVVVRILGASFEGLEGFLFAGEAPETLQGEDAAAHDSVNAEVMPEGSGGLEDMGPACGREAAEPVAAESPMADAREEEDGVDEPAAAQNCVDIITEALEAEPQESGGLEDMEPTEAPASEDADDFTIALPSVVKSSSFLDNITVDRGRGRRKSTFVPIEESDSSDLDMDLGGDSDAEENSYGLPPYARAAADVMVAGGVDDVHIQDEDVAPGSAFVDAQAGDWGGQPAEEAVEEVADPTSRRTTGSEEFQSAESHLSPSGGSDLLEDEVSSIRSAEARIPECGGEEETVVLVSDEESSGIEVLGSEGVGEASALADDLRATSPVEAEVPQEECRTPQASPALSEDMSCSSGGASGITMSTAKPRQRRELLLESDDDDGGSDDDIFDSSGEASDDIFDSGGEASPGMEMVLEEAGASSVGAGRGDRTYLAMKKFQREKESLTRRLFSEFNANIFEGRLPSDLEVTWNPSLATTAGITKYSRRNGPEGKPEYRASVELSSKVVDCESRLRQTFCHELCHVAAWLLNHVAKPPHGKVFKHWADRAMEAYPDLNVSTCHTYDIHYKFRWQCSNDWCGRVYGRHSKSIDVDRQACGICSGRLGFLGKFNADGTPQKTRGPSKFSLFVKENYARAKEELGPHKGDHASVMKVLSEKWKRAQAVAMWDGEAKETAAPGVQSLIDRFQNQSL